MQKVEGSSPFIRLGLKTPQERGFLLGEPWSERLTSSSSLWSYSRNVSIRAEDFRNVPGWPKPGIQFKDIDPILRSPDLLAAAIDSLIDASEGISAEIDFVIAPEARGFLFGPSIAAALGAGFIPARKPDKLPPETNSASYSLEYGEDHLHIAHGDLAGKQILIHDDLLATGGTVGALAKLVRQAGASAVGAVFLSEIPALGGRGSLEPLAVRSVVQFTD